MREDATGLLEISLAASEVGSMHLRRRMHWKNGLLHWARLKTIFASSLCTALFWTDMICGYFASFLSCVKLFWWYLSNGWDLLSRRRLMRLGRRYPPWRDALILGMNWLFAVRMSFSGFSSMISTTSRALWHLVWTGLIIESKFVFSKPSYSWLWGGGWPFENEVKTQRLFVTLPWWWQMPDQVDCLMFVGNSRVEDRRGLPYSIFG